MSLPVIVRDNDASLCISATWENDKGGARGPVVPVESVLSKRPYNHWIRTNRCLIPANCFFARNAGKVYCIRILGHRSFGIGGLLTSDGQHSSHHAFTMLSSESSDVLRGVTDRLPLIIRVEDAREWLYTPHISRLMQFADDATAQWFDFFEVSARVTAPDVNDAQLLKPIGLSNAELQEREERLRAMQYSEDRIIRRNTKGR